MTKLQQTINRYRKLSIRQLRKRIERNTDLIIIDRKYQLYGHIRKMLFFNKAYRTILLIKEELRRLKRLEIAWYSLVFGLCMLITMANVYSLTK